MFRSNCRDIFTLIFEQVECVIDIPFSLRDLALQELVKIIVVGYIKDLRLKFKFIMNCTLHLFKDQHEDDRTIGPKHVDGIII
jgi:hypothetical protein